MRQIAEMEPTVHDGKEKKKKMNFSSTWVLFLFLLLLPLVVASIDSIPGPTPWPPQFHSLCFLNYSNGVLKMDELWYDWPNGRNLDIVQPQLGQKLYQLEWINGTFYNYTMDGSNECITGYTSNEILGPSFLEGLNYSGQEEKDGFLCNVWEKDLVRYYEDVVTKRPVFWTLFTSAFAGLRVHVMTFEVGKVLEESNWQPPTYCFESKATNKGPLLESPHSPV